MRTMDRKRDQPTSEPASHNCYIGFAPIHCQKSLGQHARGGNGAVRNPQ
jgi:hypothetical protein